MTDEYQKQQSRQLDREARDRAIGAARSAKRREEQTKRSGLSTTTTGLKLREKAIDGVVAEIQRQIDIQEIPRRGAKASWYKYIADTYDDGQGNILPTVTLSEIAETALIVCLDAVGNQWSWNATLSYAGRAFEMTRFAAILKRNRPGKRLYNELEEGAKQVSGNYHQRVTWAKETAVKRGFSIEPWDDDTLRNVGSFLVDVVQMGSNLVKIDKKVNPNSKKPHPVLILTLTDEAADQLREHNDLLDGLSSRFGPMTSPPIHYTTYPNTYGPYLDPAMHRMVPMVKKVWSPEHQEALKRACEVDADDNCQMAIPLDAINRLMAVPFEINQFTLEAVIWAKNEGLGGRLGKLPTMIELALPDKMDKEKFSKLPKDKQIERAKNFKEVVAQNLEIRANLKTVDVALTEAKELVNIPFWLPHQFDKRGRIYHTSDFGHHNSDWMRGLIMFWNKTPIGEEGLPFLELALANAWGNGVDKFSLIGRQEWVADNLEKILRCGQDYKAGLPFWRQADDPVQFLAACHERYNYERDPNYESGLMIGLDATNSGYQHYAAASLNKEDGENVNLTPRETPADLYTACLIKASEIFEGDLLRNEKIVADDPKSPEAGKASEEIRIIEQLKAWGGITRKHIKRPTMTWAYSSRMYGFMLQIRSDWMNDLTRQLRQGNLRHPVTDEPVTEHPFGEDKGFRASVYIARVFQDAIEDTVNSARDGQEFFQKCARALANENKHFTFTTPVGFPMAQFYRVEGKRKRPRVFLTDKASNLPIKQAKAYVTTFTDEVAMPKSENAVSPNIIHAMDASHLMLTVNMCEDYGVTDIAVVHDSFSTTIGNAKVMSTCIRQAFVNLYKDYCLYTAVLEQTIARLDDPANADLPTRIPDKGTLDIELVLQSDYFAS